MKKQLIAFGLSLALCLAIVSPVFAEGQGGGTTTGNTVDTGLSLTQIGGGLQGATTTTPATLLIRIMNTLFGLLGTIALLMFVYAGFKWMMAGTSDDTKASMNLMKNAAIGIFIILAAYSISTFIFSTLTKVTGTTGL